VVIGFIALVTFAMVGTSQAAHAASLKIPLKSASERAKSRSLARLYKHKITSTAGSKTIPVAVASVSSALALSSQKVPMSLPKDLRPAAPTTPRSSSSQASLPFNPTLPKELLPLLPTFPTPPASSSSAKSSSSSSSESNSTLASLRQEILRLTNEERKKAGVHALTMNSRLQKSAQGHAEDMVARDFFDHTNPDGKTPSNRIKEAGYPEESRKCNCAWQYYDGENIAQGFKTAADVMKGWMNSPGHKENILSKNFDEIGIGFKDNRWVQNFGAYRTK
jgi:uncharacterized protein YkwD